MINSRRRDNDSFAATSSELPGGSGFFREDPTDLWTTARRLPPDASCAATARSLIRVTLTALELPDDFIHAVQAVAGELAANAITHAPVPALPELWTHLARFPEPRLVVSIFDTDSDHEPGLIAPNDSRRGLRIVAALSVACGTRLTRSRIGPRNIPGKAVWAALNLPATGSPAPPLTTGQPSPHAAAELLHATLSARGIGHIYRRCDDRLQVISVRAGLTIWVGETFSWQADAGQYVHQPLCDIADVTEKIVDRYERLGRSRQLALPVALSR
jgi:hypothetical protein